MAQLLQSEPLEVQNFSESESIQERDTDLYEFLKLFRLYLEYDY